jgi:hypothetical protein
MQSWEYRIEWIDPRNKGQAEFLNAIGSEGWELVSVIIHRESARFVAYFKRPISS